MNKTVVYFYLILVFYLAFFTQFASYANAGVVVSFDLENGQVPNSGEVNPNLIPATVLTESNGNHFLRMTASPSDCGPSFSTTCPRTRAEIWIGSTPGSGNQTATFSFAMRIPSSNPGGQYNLLFQLFQGLGDPINGGKTIWIGSQNGRLFLENDLTHTTADLGSINYDQWTNFSLVVYLTTNPSQGRADAYINGALAGSIVGEATEKMADITNMYLDVIDFGGVLGIADFDNLQISTGGSVPTTPTPTPPPSNSCTNLWDSSTLPVTPSFGAAFNWFSAGRELLMNAICTANSATLNVGNGSSNEYIYKTGYTWSGSQWAPFTYSGNLDASGNWILGSASASVAFTAGQSTPESALAYICEWTGGAWMCGCNNSSCATNYWNLQQFK